MSFFTITVDEFMKLTLPQHQQGVALYDREIASLKTLLDARQPVNSVVSQEAHVAKWQEELENFQKLREVHQNRIEELMADATETDGSTVAIAA